MSITNNKQDASTRANIYDIIFSNDANIIIIAAGLVEEQEKRYQAGIYGISGNDAKMRFGLVDYDLITYMRFTNVANFISGT